jgi:hypothetical protein
MDSEVSSLMILLSDTRLTVITPAAGCVASTGYSTIYLLPVSYKDAHYLPERPVKRGG